MENNQGKNQEFGYYISNNYQNEIKGNPEIEMKMRQTLNEILPHKSESKDINLVQRRFSMEGLKSEKNEEFMNENYSPSNKSSHQKKNSQQVIAYFLNSNYI